MSKRIGNIHEVVRRLIGLIEPQGESNIDETVDENLRQMIMVTESLINDIIFIARHRSRHEASINKVGKRADNFISELERTLNELR
jgi:fructose-1,6-bisphosphatase/sedoheptulose 1,7-bisphosphatase-like protein